MNSLSFSIHDAPQKEKTSLPKAGPGPMRKDSSYLQYSPLSSILKEKMGVDVLMKTANRNLLLFVIPAALGLILGIVLLVRGDAIVGAAKGMVPQAPQGEVGDVEGYAMIGSMVGAGLGGLAGFAIQLFGMMAILYTAALLILSGVTRLVYGPTPGRILAYRILMGVTVVVLLSPVPDILRTFVRALADGSFLPLWLVYLVVVFLIAVKVCRNTYTDKIYH